MTSEVYPEATHDLSRTRRELAPGAAAAFNEFGKAVFADGALSPRPRTSSRSPSRTSRNALIAFAVTRAPRCARALRIRS